MATTPQLLRDFQDEERDLRLRQAKVAAVLGVILFPAGIFLDYALHADIVTMLLGVRVAAAAMIGIIFALLMSDRLKTYVEPLTMAGLLVAVGSIALMVSITGGADSTYYLGLFLILFSIGVLAPMKTEEAAVFCIATVLIYIISCSTTRDATVLIPKLLNNLYFLVLTSIISVTAAHLNYRRRYTAFTMKYKLAEQHKQLSELDRLKSQFFANVSHELRTPLTLILAPLEKIRADSTFMKPTTHGLIEIVENNALRLLRLVNDILSLIKIEEGRSEFAMKAFDLSGFLRATHSSMKHLAEMKSVTLSLEDSDGHLFILADPEAMDKIVTNVVTNAIKFTPEHGNIRISAMRTDAEVVIEFTDTGIGIPADKLPHIFDRFYQVDGSTTRRHQGLGLGLAMVRELTQRLNGSVVASSIDGAGTTFTLRFPLLSEDTADARHLAGEAPAPVALEPLQELHRKAARQEIASTPSRKRSPVADYAAVRAPSTAPEEALPVASGKSTLLIVDDEPDMRQFLSTMLSEDYLIIEATDGPEALEMARNHLPDLMLLDVMLPGLSGLDVCKLLKESPDTRGIKMIVLTARADEEAKIVALKHGADDFLIKPFSALEVRTRLTNLLKAALLEKSLQGSNRELKQSLKQLKDTEAALVQNARLSALGTMAAGLLHEIGNPLNYMGTALQIAGRSEVLKQNPGTNETIQDIQAGYDRIRRIVSDLRGFTAPQRPENARPFDLNEAVEHALRFTAHQRRGIVITKQSDGPAIVVGSLSSISQVLVNLVINAMAAVKSIEDRRQPEIAISIETKDQHAIVKVRDNGTGIDPAIQERIFDPFFSTKDAGEGMGLGLAVSHRIVTNHQGLLEVKSNPGEWTEFVFALPLVAIHPATRDQHAAA